jgi:DNA-binding SARP family transcriptional activator/tetratricopeptide (TPR) repeat protein
VKSLLKNLPFELRVTAVLELIDRSNGAVIPVTSAKMRALLLYLSSAPRFSETRRGLAGLLWPDSGDKQARQSLRQLLSNFRRSMPAKAQAIVTFDDTAVRLDPSCVAIDRDCLARIGVDATIADLEEAAASYRGDFGNGAEIGENEFDGWLQSERTRTRDIAIGIFDRLVRALSDASRHQDALARANRLVEIEPLREESHRLVIAEEAIVSGRASAMLRYESFRILLRDELGVCPEPATVSLIESLRNASGPQGASTRETGLQPGSGIAAADGAPVKRPQRYRFIAATLVVVAISVSVAGWMVWRHYDTPTYFVGEDAGSVSVVIAPFEGTESDDALRSRSAELEAETRMAFTRSTPRLSVVQMQGATPSHDPVQIGRQLRARYTVMTRLVPKSGQADITLYDSTTGVAVSAGTVPLSGERIKFAREVFRYVYPQISLHRAKTLSVSEPDSISALLWRAEAARIKTRVGEGDSTEFKLFEAVLAREPHQFYALLGLSECFILRVARDQSKQRQADIRRAADLLRQAREQAPQLAEIAFLEGMLNKLQGKFELAEPDFERSFRLDRTHWNAAAQAAHVKIFLGRFEEAYAEMEGATKNLLPDLAAAETAYIAGETALVAGHPDRAVAYLEMANAGNATIARIHGLYAAALWMAGRQAEAREAAALSQSLTPSYPLAAMARRGGPNTNPRYKAARDQYAAAFKAALAPDRTN